MERNIQRHGLVNFLVLLLVGVSAWGVSRFSHLQAGEVAAVFLGLGLLVSLVSWFQMRLEERERFERLEFDELNQAAASGTLFETQQAENFPARHAREQFEKYVVPAFGILLLVLQGAAAFVLWRWLRRAPEVSFEQPLVAMGLMALFALVLFLVGKYAAGVARLENLLFLRASANYLLLNAYLCALLVAELVAFEAGFKVDRLLALGLCLLLGLLAAESLVTLVLEIYRPRVKGKILHLLYDSRLVGLLSQPESVFSTAAHALDYQFGFKVSETWFYRFLQRALVWLLLAQGAILLLSTCFVFVNPGEQALLERFGRPVEGRDVLNPGPHVKWFWPIDRVQRYRTEEIQTFHIGLEHDEGEGGDDHKETTVLWTVSHYKQEFNLLIASRDPLTATNTDAGRKAPPVNLLSVAIPVQYQIQDLRAWAYHHSDPSKLLESLGTREAVRYLVGMDFNEIMSTGRFRAGEELRQRIQAAADQRELGVKVLFVGLQDVHPPVAVGKSFEAVVSARQKREANLLAARAHEVATNALARAEAVRIHHEAQAESARVSVAAVARAALFTNQIPAYRASPSVYAQRAYLQTLARAGGNAKKVILATTNTHDVILMDLQEKLRPDLLDIPLTVPTKK
jgi:regulator of protease activity HflC (stomatin/prohibitin superfamily)